MHTHTYTHTVRADDKKGLGSLLDIIADYQVLTDCADILLSPDALNSTKLPIVLCLQVCVAHVCVVWSVL
jgi:hypothetical protein